MNESRGKIGLPLTLLLILAAVFVWSAINPRERLTWIFEILPTLIELTILILTYRKFRFTDFSYVLLFIHAVLPMLGGHYTYAHMPLFDWVRDQFGFSRNHYDRFVHFTQGFIAALFIREILIRLSPLKHGFWLFLTTVCIIAANSVLYELTEFAAAKFTGKSANEFLGTQGDIWDSQWDMLMAFAGGVLGYLILSRNHNAALDKFRRTHRP